MTKQQQKKNIEDNVGISAETPRSLENEFAPAALATEPMKQEAPPEALVEMDAESSEACVEPVQDIIEMVEAVKLDFFRTPGTASKAFCVIPDHLGGAVEIDSDRFRSWLRAMVYKAEGKRPGQADVKLAVEHFVDETLANAPEHTPVVRFAFRDGVATLDIGDSTNRVIEVDKSGWRVVNQSGIKFVRTEGMRPMLIPVNGGSIEDWKRTINIADEDWSLFIPAVLAMFRADLPTAILQLYGEQGSAKSTVCEQIRALVDPSQAPLRGRPRSERDVFISAMNSRLLVYDNLSEISPEISDALCRLATGGAFSTRMLHSNSSELLINATRPVVMNGIADLSRRPDLLSRVVTVTCPRIDPGKRRTKSEIDKMFEDSSPRILGALLTAFAGTLQQLPTVHVAELPRMADFARFGAAAEIAMKMRKGSFLEAYARNQLRLDDIALEGEPVAMVLIDWHSKHGDWKGASRELLRVIEGAAKKAGVSRERGSWPASPFGLTSTLRRIAPNLRSKGVDVVIGGHTRQGVSIAIKSTASTAA